MMRFFTRVSLFVLRALASRGKKRDFFLLLRSQRAARSRHRHGREMGNEKRAPLLSRRGATRRSVRSQDVRRVRPPRDLLSRETTFSIRCCLSTAFKDSDRVYFGDGNPTFAHDIHQDCSGLFPIGALLFALAPLKVRERYPGASTRRGCLPSSDLNLETSGCARRCRV